MKYKCLSIAGFDGSGGAGLQADLKAFSAFGCYGMTILTAIAVQNTRGVKQCYDIPLNCIEMQLETIFEDIIPDSIKIGMLFSQPIIELIAHFLEKRAKHIPIVLDPVMVAKSGDHLLQPEAIQALKTKMIPLATIITPNLPESYCLSQTDGDFETIGKALLALGPNAVLLKGGHTEDHFANDLFLDQTGTKHWLKAKRIPSKNTHGTGCTLSAAISAGLAHGVPLYQACAQAKHYLSGAIQAAKDCSVGTGHGPVHHFYHIWPNLPKITGAS